MNDHSCLKPKSKINEILNELNRTNKSLKDLSKAITLHSPKEAIIKNTCDLNGSSFVDTKSSLSQTNIILNHTKLIVVAMGKQLVILVVVLTFKKLIVILMMIETILILLQVMLSIISILLPPTLLLLPLLVIKVISRTVDKYYKDLDKCAKVVDFDINSRDIVNNKNDNINHGKISKFNATNTDDSNNTTNNNAINNDDSKNHRDNGNIEDINGKISNDVDKDTAKAKANSDLKTDRKEVEGRKSIFIVGDSVIKELKGFELSKSIGHKKPVKVRSHPSAQIRCLTDHI